MAILKKLSEVLNLKFSDLISTMSSDYTKRFGETKYDDLMATDAGTYLKQLPQNTKYLLELIMYFFSGAFEQKFEANSPLRKYFKEIFSDSASELAKRMMNGVHTDLGKTPFTLEHRTLMELLCELDETTLKNIVAKLYAMDARERKIIMSEFEHLNPEKLIKVAAMNEPDFQQFSAVFQPKKSFWKSETESLKALLTNYVAPKKEEKS